MSQIASNLKPRLQELKKFLFSSPWRFVALLAILITTTMKAPGNLFQRFDNWRQLSQLKKEKKELQKALEIDRKHLEDLRNSKDDLERYAREKFYMKADNEDLYIIKER